MKKRGTVPSGSILPKAPLNADVRELFCRTFAEFSEVADKLDGSRTPHFDFDQDVKLWSIGWFIKEAHRLGYSLGEAGTDKEIARHCYQRLLAWAVYRIKWHAFLALKECPEQQAPSSDAAKAAFAGLLLSDQSQLDNPLVDKCTDWLKTAPKNFHSLFRKWVCSPSPERWKYPELDSWLLCVWPVVELKQWNPRSVWLTAQQKFPDIEGPVFNSARIFKDHLAKDLKLECSGQRPPGRPRNDDFGLPPLADFALSIDVFLPANSLFENG